MSENRAEQLSDIQSLPGPQSDDLLASRTPSANRPMILITLPWVEVLYPLVMGLIAWKGGGKTGRKQNHSCLPYVPKHLLSKCYTARIVLCA